MEKRILIDQLNDRITRALAIILKQYPRLKDNELSDEEAKGLITLADSLRYLMSVIYDVVYNDNLEKYKGEIFKIARGNRDE